MATAERFTMTVDQLLDGIRKITPVGGGFTFSVGTHTNQSRTGAE